MRYLKKILLALAAVTLIVGWGCESRDGEESAASTPRGDKETVTVEMTNDLKYEPEKVTVLAGDTVVWNNVSDVGHTVTAKEELAKNPEHVKVPEGAEEFDSGNIKPGETFQYTFEVAGEYVYFCIPHESAGMVGEVIVEEIKQEDR